MLLLEVEVALAVVAGGVVVEVALAVVAGGEVVESK